MTSRNPEIEIITRLELYFSVRNTARSIRAFAELFDYDYDSAVIFLTVAEVCFQAVFHLAPSGYELGEVEKIYAQVAAAGLSVMTIGEITGIPRETARRKVKSLIDEGFLAPSEGGRTVYLPLSTIISERVIGKLRNQYNEAIQYAKMINYYQKTTERPV
jgi:hypothetical protein